MVGTYAVINTATGVVENSALWDGESDWPLPEGCIAVLAEPGVDIGWTYADSTFSAPPVVPPTAAEILAANTNTQALLLASATQAMTPLLLSLQLGDATADETTKAKSWQTYYRAVQAVDLTVEAPTWPSAPDQ